jgi:hypothetical protein
MRFSYDAPALVAEDDLTRARARAQRGLRNALDGRFGVKRFVFPTHRTSRPRPARQLAPSPTDGPARRRRHSGVSQ